MIEQQRLFIANASHELRTPLTNIKLRSEALLDGGLDDPAIARRYLGDIDSEADRLARLANTLLDLSRLERGTGAPPTEAVDIAPVLLAVARSARLGVHAAGLSLRADIPTQLPPLRVWPEQVEAALVNLLDNAVKYTPKGGEVRLSVQVVDGNCQILVADTGLGIPAEDIPHIFERFYRVDKARSRRSGSNSSGGAGLGLAIVKVLAEQNGGRIRAESVVGAGTTFILEFPFSQSA
jgi:signal transduction histidine kinase